MKQDDLTRCPDCGYLFKPIYEWEEICQKCSALESEPTYMSIHRNHNDRPDKE